MEKKAEYVLRMDSETAHLVSRACELYARLRCGQFEELRYLTLFPDDTCKRTFSERIDDCSRALKEARKAAFPELDPRGSYGVGHFRDSDIAWNTYQVMRYVMAWYEHPEGGNTVNFNKPLKVTDTPMPMCEVISRE